MAAPNPVLAGALTITVGLPAGGPVRLDLIDLEGRKVAKIYDGIARAGWTRMTWDATGSDGRRIGSGAYLLHMQTASGDASRKIIVMR
jgi:flagellar hook assembly protein FlgD